jgi:RNA-directed DNA polymerase
MAKRDRETKPRWDWVEPSVWTERMLVALEQGVRGGKWYSLNDKVMKPANLLSAFGRVKANKGSAGTDNVTIEMFEQHLDEELDRLAEQLGAGTYEPQAVKRVHIPKPGSNKTRPLGIPTVRDRVVQTALRNVIEPIYEQGFAEHSYGFRPGRGAKDALRYVDQKLKEGWVYVVDADLQSYFDTIPKNRLMKLVEEQVIDRKVLGLIEAFLNQEVMEAARHWTPETGTPQGAVISPLLANIYLDPLDHLMADAGFEMVRYADDFVILCRTRQTAKTAMRMVKEWTEGVGLTLHPDKTHIAHAIPDGFEFLGYHFHKGERWPREKSLKKLKDTVRAKTKRTNGHSMERIVAALNRTLHGWYNYFKHSKWFVFERLDQWIRVRLRAILRRRRGLKGRARGEDHRRWKNAYFAELGLFSLHGAYQSEHQSALR